MSILFTKQKLYCSIKIDLIHFSRGVLWIKYGWIPTDTNSDRYSNPWIWIQLQTFRIRYEWIVSEFVYSDMDMVRILNLRFKYGVFYMDTEVLRPVSLGKYPYHLHPYVLPLYMSCNNLPPWPVGH